MELPAATHRLGALLGLAALIASLAAEAGIGRTRGYASVSPLGEAEYSIPIAVPPGTNGMTPALSLEYRHRTRGGLLGVGWSIGGLSQITRCARTVAQDGASSAPSMNALDRFCLDGQRLVTVGSTGYWVANAEYRTEIESFARIRAVQGSSSNGPAYFTVETADGLMHEYGATPDSRIDGAQGPSTGGARSWALNRTRDRAGNVIDYSYVEEPVGAAFRIAAVHYNANPSNGIAASHAISFRYENRPNSEVDAGFVAGMPVRQVVRLERIEILYGNSELRRYELGYEPSLSSGGRSRLASVRECAAGVDECLAATTFRWHAGTSGMSDLPGVAAPIPAGYVVPGRTGWTFADVNGDGRSDLLWAGGSSVDSSTLHYRLGLADGSLGSAVNSGIATRLGLGVPIDADGDGRSDRLLRSANGNFAIAHGSPAGLLAAADTGIAIPAGMHDLRGADMNGDGLGDLVWSEAPGSQPDDLQVRARFALAAGGYGPATTLYSQRAAMGYEGVEGGGFIGARVDLDGDGAEEILLNENYSIARIAAAGHANDRFDSQFTGLVALRFNDDDCTDYAYKHVTGTLRVRLGSCTTLGSSTEIQGPPWSGNAYAQVHDWNGDGRDDILLRGAVNWQVALSRGDSIAPVVDTGMPHENAPTSSGRDIDGDGLQDFALQTGNSLRLRLRDGPVPDLLDSASDGFGVASRFTYAPLTDPSVHVAGKGAKYPEQDLQTNDNVVALLKTTDGSGRGYLSSTAFRYEGLRRDARGRGVLGFRKRVRTETSAPEPLVSETLQRIDFPFAGLPELVVVRRASGQPVSSTEYRWSKLEWSSASSVRRFPYATSVTTRHYEAGGNLDGSEVVRTVRAIAAIDPTSGVVTDETTTTTEIAGGMQAGSSAALRVQQIGVFNDTPNWCLGRVQSVQLTASHTLAGGAPVVRGADQDWDGAKCRPTRIRLQPGDSLWQVTNDFTYDGFGNLTSEKVTGAGMAARTVAIAWDARGQFPIRVADPLAQMTRYAWDAGHGRPVAFTDPNSAVTRWEYDAFGRLARETQPDRTASRWRREACKGGCDDRIRYLLHQDELSSAGALLLTSTLSVDQHDRGYRLKSPQPVGGKSITGVDFDWRGAVTSNLLPHWEGDLAPPRWNVTYDGLGRPTRADLQDPGAPVAQSERLNYDGLALTRTDPLGRSTTLTRSAWGPVTQVTDPAGGSTHYESDAFGALLHVRDALGNGVASIDYNAGGMKLAVADMDRGAWSWARNALGETTELRDAKGAVTRFEHDKLGRLTKRIAPDGTSTWTWGSTAAKDDIGRLAAIAGPGYSEEFTYDSIGRPATHSVISDARYTFSFAYNALGLLDVLTFPAAGAGNPVKLRHEYQAGRVTRLRNADPPADPWWSLNAQDAWGNALDETLGPGLRVVSGFSPLTGKLEYRLSTAGGTVVQDLDWTWDDAGNLVRRRDLAQGLAEEFSYDALDRLVESRRNGSVDLELSYDATGNILRKSDLCAGTAPCYAYDPKRRHAVISAGTRKFAYDANGNMTKRDGATIAWTSDDLPRSVAHPSGNSSQLFYGPAGNRWKQVAKTGAAIETTHYAGDGFEKAVQGGVTTWRHYLPTPGGVAVLLRRSDGSAAATRYLTLDHLGSTDRITDAAGKVIVSESFGAFGARRRPDWTGVPTAAELAQLAAVTRDGFTGHEQLDNVELIHMNGRVYDPLLGRFISADPFVWDPHDGQGLNRYGYALNNPLAFTDPSGFDAVPCLATQSGDCVQITVIGVTWAQYMRAAGGAHAAEIASALERDPCGQNGSALACSMASGMLVSPSSIVLTVGRNADSSLPTSGRFDAIQGFAARVANLAIGSSPVALLFGADPEFQYFREPENGAGQAGAAAGNVGFLLGGAVGMVRRASSEALAGSTSRVAQSFQGRAPYFGIDRFRDIRLKKGTLLYAGFPGQSAFYTTASAIRRAGGSSQALFGGLQVAAHRSLGLRARYAVYEVIQDTQAAFALALANPSHGRGWLPQVVVPSYESSLRYLGNFPLIP